MESGNAHSHGTRRRTTRPPRRPHCWSTATGRPRSPSIKTAASQRSARGCGAPAAALAETPRQSFLRAELADRHTDGNAAMLLAQPRPAAPRRRSRCAPYRIHGGGAGAPASRYPENHAGACAASQPRLRKGRLASGQSRRRRRRCTSLSVASLPVLVVEIPEALVEAAPKVRPRRGRGVVPLTHHGARLPAAGLASKASKSVLNSAHERTSLRRPVL